MKTLSYESFSKFHYLTSHYLPLTGKPNKNIKEVCNNVMCQHFVLESRPLSFVMSIMLIVLCEVRFIEQEPANETRCQE